MNGNEGATAVTETVQTTVIIGLGNPLRADDGVGTAVVEALRAQGGVPPSVALLDGGTAGLEMALLWQGYERLILVDTVEMDCPPGTWRRFALGDVTVYGRSAMRGTLHDAGVAEALALSEALGTLPPQVVVYGIQPQTVAWRLGLSAAVAAAVAQVCAAIKKEIGARKYLKRQSLVNLSS